MIVCLRLTFLLNWVILPKPCSCPPIRCGPRTFLTDARLINNVRGVQGYTGMYEGVRVSVMASGMGMPSMGIYSYELYNFYNVKNIIRVGSAGAINEAVKLRDVVFAMGACTNSAYASMYRLPGSFAPIADYGLLRLAQAEAEKLGVRYHVGNVLSSDNFYNDDDSASSKWGRMGEPAIEMETAALYCNAARCSARALTICTVSDHILTGESTTAEERQTTFTDMMKIALGTAVRAAEDN